MENTIETPVAQRILVQDLDKLQSYQIAGNSYPVPTFVVERASKPLDGFVCVYDLLEIPKDFIIQISLPNSHNNFMNNFRSNSSKEKVTAQIVHIDQLKNQHNFNSLKRVELFAKNKPTFLPRPQGNNYYWNDGFVTVLVDEMLKVPFPYNHYNNQHLPVTIFKKENTYLFRVLGFDFDLLNAVTASSQQYHRNEKLTEVDAKLMNMTNKFAVVKNALRVNETSFKREELNDLLQVFANVTELPLSNTEGIAKTFNSVKTFYENLFKTDFLSALAVKAVADSCKSTVNGIKYSTVFNKLFTGIETQEAFDKKAVDLSNIYLKNLTSIYSYSRNSFLTDVLDTLSEAREMKKAVLKRKSTGAFNKIMDDLEFIDIDQVKYPISYAAVTSGEIPTSTFFRKSGESYFIYNDNWDIWEEMLQSHKEVAISIAAECSRRTTYEKDIMSYFYFVLHALPEYLERNTGKKWKGIPKLVDSANELDPPTEGSNGVAKTRSALTPIVDNEKSEVVVPYVSMKIGGYQTTYCYGLNYSVLEKGFSFNGNVVSKDVEAQLNGRDNYGLMFYTLTGSSQGRGYPTFLIIFENMDKEKYGQNFRVHFHRTHPMRSKGGDYNPIHNWTKGCYKWMIGNVNYERILAQQGDLAFVKIDALPEGEYQEVNAYDNHRFAQPVRFLPYNKKEKQNILGYVELEFDTTLEHNEHLNREIPKGIYEIRQCRSWEANPKGIWSLRID